MAAALKEAYGDLFLIKAKPTKADSAAITGKFKSFHNASDDVAQRMSKTFFALLDLADLSAIEGTPSPPSEELEADQGKSSAPPLQPQGPAQLSGLYYNIQIHLPATKEVEVYNAIFKSLREHFVV